MSKKLQYKVEIRGNDAPFKWYLSGPPVPPNTNDRHESGEADSYTDALAEAHAEARAMEQRRIHALTRRTEVVLEVEAEVPAYDPFDDLAPINR